MRKFPAKISSFWILGFVFLTVSPAHANVALPVPFPGNFQSFSAHQDVAALENLQSGSEKSARESALADKLNEIQTLRYLMRSA